MTCSHRILVTLPALLAVVVTAACGDGSTPASTVPPTAPVAADPTGDWRYVDGPVAPLPGADVTVTFGVDDAGAQQIGGRAACNSYGGPVDWGSDGSITVGGVAATEMACEPAVMELEQAFFAALAGFESFAVIGDRLSLTGPDGTWTFEPLAPPPTAELVGTTWILSGLVDGPTASAVAGMEMATLTLGADGSVSGSTPCRVLSGTWTEAGGEILFPDFGAEGECTDPALADLDARIVTVLGDGFRVEFDGVTLTVLDADGTGLTYTPG